MLNVKSQSKFIDLQKKKKTWFFYVFIDYQLICRGIYGPKKEIVYNKAARDVLNNIGRISEDNKHTQNKNVLSTLFIIELYK